MRKLLLLICLLVSNVANAQENKAIEEAIEFYQQDAANEEIDYQILFEHLQHYRSKPLAINGATEEQLASLYLLNPLQISALINYQKQHGKLLEWQELLRINGFSNQLVILLKQFCTLTDELIFDKQFFQYLRTEAKAELTTRLSQQFTKAKAYQKTATTSPIYKGNPLKSYTRLRYHSTGKFSAGLIFEKDPGEQWFNAMQSYTPDFCSGHFYLKNNKSFLKELALGDFQVSAAQGLIFNSALGFNKSAQTLMVKNNSQGLRPYTSVNENEFFRGAAMSIGKKKFHATMLISKKKIDGTINDSTGDLSALLSTGLHRSDSELARRKTVNELICGFILRQGFRKLDVGFNFVDYKISTITKSKTSSSAASLDFKLLLPKGIVFGEIALDRHRHKAYLFSLVQSLGNNIGFSALYRNYEPNFSNRYGNPFSASGRNYNEKGLYMGLEYKLSNTINLSVYLDQYRYQAPSFYTKTSAQQKDILAQLSYNKRKKHSLYLRARLQDRQRDFNDDKLINESFLQKKLNLRLNGELIISPSLTLRNRVEYSFRTGNLSNGLGYLVYQDLLLDLPNQNVSISTRYAIFQTTSFDDRIYAFENDVLYSYAIPAYFDTGQRFYIMVQKKFKRNITLWIRYSNWIYLNKNIQGSGNDEFLGNKKPQLTVQLRLLFK